MQKVKPRIGLYLFQSQWFKDVGLTGGREDAGSSRSLNENIQADVACGESLSGPPRIPGAPHFNVRLDAPLDRFFEQAAEWGVTHHWAIVHGDFVPQLESLARMLSVPLRVIR